MKRHFSVSTYESIPCIIPYNFALGDQKKVDIIASANDVSVSASISNIGDVYNKVVTETIDDLFMDEAIIDFIKMDIEGMEPYAIIGGIKTITKNRPKMCISAYHRTNHLWEIPLLIHNNFPQANIYLGHQYHAPFEMEYYINWDK